jgi:hypothetical protein
VLHDVLSAVLEPLRKVMEDGINLICPDNQRRLCFPVVAQYIADYEEQRVLGSILTGHCPKCTIPAYRSPEDERLAERPPGQDAHAPGTQSMGYAPRTQMSDANNMDHAARTQSACSAVMNHAPHTSPTRFDLEVHAPRTAFEAKRLRSLYPRFTQLKKYGYHVTKPFTERYIHSDIHDALAPDLLHQISKCFYDYLHKWIMNLVEKTAHVTLEKVKGEIDARFSQIPPYPKLRAFRQGITSTSRWTGNEFKNMLRVYLGVVRDLLPPAGVKLIKVYLDIHRLAHYVSHTESTLSMLQNAIDEFVTIRNDPNGPFVIHGVLAEGWYCPKIHYLHHYVAWVKRMGVLPYCSTDRTEAWHKPLKASYRASNKGPQAPEFILRDEARSIAWSIWEALLSLDQIHRLSDLDVDEDEAGNDLDERIFEMEEEVPERTIKSVRLTASKRWTGLREVGLVAQELGLKDLVTECERYLRWVRLGRRMGVRSRMRYADVERERVEIAGHVSLRIRYPTVHDPAAFIEEILYSTIAWNYGTDASWRKLRYDTVLVRYREPEGDHTMANRRVAQVLLLFSTCTSTNDKLELAFVQLFQTITPIDRLSGMYKVRKQPRYEVIEIETIERGVHLIPCFNGLQTRMANGRSTPALNVYTDFWVNNQIDLHMYNTIY